MQRSNDYSLFIISDVPYLLPFGQGIADLKRGVQINDTGMYLWGLLDRDLTEDEILSLYAAHYEIPDSHLPQLKADLEQFLHMLECYGILQKSGTRTDLNAADIPVSADSIHSQSATSPVGQNHTEKYNSAIGDNAIQRYLSIGGLTILLCGSDKAFSHNFDAFEIFPDSDTASAASGNCSSHIDHITTTASDTIYSGQTSAKENISHISQTATTAGNSLPTDQTVSTPGNILHADQTVSNSKNAIHIDQTVTVIDHAPAQHSLGSTLIQTHELVIMEDDLQYVFLFPDAPGIHEAHLTKDGSDARYFCCPPYTESLQQDLFHAIRLSFLYLAQLHDMVVLHSASLLYRGKAWLFSGHSGAGKSTHTNLWKELYEVPLINGDLNLLSMENGCPMIHGLPWCGTSGISDTHSYPLGGILLVKKALQNHAAALDTSHAQLLVAQRLISPCWTETLMQKNLSFVAELAPHILICRLHCTKTPEAAETGKQAIDDYLQRSEM